MSKKIVIVGGVAGGATAIARMRRLDEQAEIILLERGEYVSFANCGLPYYIGGVIEQREALFVSTPEAIMAKYHVDVRVQSEAIAIDRINKKVQVKNLKNDELYQLPYDKLLLSTGSTPIKPNVEGFDGENVFTLWNIPDTDRVYEYIEQNNPKTATVIGGGFIGLEMAENLAHRGIAVTVVEKANQVMAPIDYDMAQIVHGHLREKGIDLIVENGVQRIRHLKSGSIVVLEDGRNVPADLVILSIGIRPNNELAKSARLQLNERGGVVVNEYMQTDDESIYAVGDITEIEDFILKNKTMVPLAGPANKQGRIAADNMILGNRQKYSGAQGTSVAKIFDLTVASTGANEKTLQRMGKKYGEDYKITTIHSNSHAGYYPNAGTMVIKVIFGQDGKLFGAQIVGYDGVDKRIDVLATSIRLGADVYDLTELELAYAPPYSSAKDPVNMAGYTAVNQLEKLVEVVRVEELADLDKDTILVDVREPMEREMGYIPNSISVPLGQIRNRIGEFDKSKKYIVSCAVGLRGYIASRILKQYGFQVKNLMGGYRSYSYFYGSGGQSPVEKFEDSGVAGTKKSNEPSDVSNHQAAKSSSEGNEALVLNVCGLCCPGPIVEVSRALEKMEDGEILQVISTDPGFYSDINSWANSTGNELIERSSKEGKFYAMIKKKRLNKEISAVSSNNLPCKEKTMIVFSGDLDKAIASFIIANGAAAMGNKVNMFFTFWGLNILRKNGFVPTEKDFISKMFGWMMPRGSKRLGLSKMNMFGAGSVMIRSVMKKQNVYSLEELIQQAIDSGVKLTACQMSMDVMGIKKEELIDGIEIGGVATMLEDNDNSNMNLFI
ncbi:MAG: FAD-dependent oxidoreductase [Peptostreptococcaceae bacterium]|nr:FAD-dependent oxidoreductase [Peptostreptococcaceae bacterium]